jgi:hypothetical protein
MATIHDVGTIFSLVNGASFVSIDTETTPALKGGASNRMKGRVTKKMVGAKVMVFQNKNSNGYENMVRRRLEAEGKNPNSFELSPRLWGERIENLPVVRHVKDGVAKFYVEVIFLAPGRVEYFLDGSPIPKNEIIGLESKEEGEQGCLENKVIVRTFSLDSITAIRVNRDEYEGPFTFAE